MRAFLRFIPRSVALVTVFTALQPSAWAGLVDEARRCTVEVQRLERLACFDAVFDTPVDLRAEAPASVPASLRSEQWRQAYASAGNPEDTGTAVYRDTGRAAGQLVTVAALGVEPPRPRLVLQCHNNITELALMMPEPLENERIQLAMGTDIMEWRVRDNGFVLSGGRGLPSIHTVQTLLRGPDVRIDSTDSAIDGLLFDLSGFGQAIKPLRERCGW